MMLRKGRPEEAGMSSRKITELEKLAAGWVEKEYTPSLVILAARKGIIVTHKAFGRLNPEPDSPPLQTDTIYPLASLSKPLTATCIMQLVEAGLVDLYNPVCRYIPEFTGEGKHLVKVCDLLTHTSGLRDADVSANADKKRGTVEIPPCDDNQNPSIHEYLYLGYDTPLWKSPSEEMVYFNFGYMLLGEIIRRVSGQSLDSFSRERIFKPLGMKDTNFIVPNSLFDRVVVRDEKYPGGKWFTTPESLRSPRASGGAYSTAMDLAIFGQTFMNMGKYGNTRILSPVSVNVMTRNQTRGVSAKYENEFFPESGWGFGWNVHDNKRDDSGCLRSARAYDHGGFGGVRLLVDPEYEVLWVFLSVQGDEYIRNLFNNAVMSSIEEL